MDSASPCHPAPTELFRVAWSRVATHRSPQFLVAMDTSGSSVLTRTPTCACTGKESNKLNPTSSVSQTSIQLIGKPVEGALDRHQGIPGFDQERYSRAHVICIGAGGLIGGVAPNLARKGIGAITILDHDEVEITNLNRQRFYPRHI